eukprot:CAMPEP_0182899494 /NCGR_PEP_ID=MMETSP0034_2-20130328/28106_1 /TAXON_ID=156128 /ORGANISM="Nephroselmis pyriformis, Strain CCMP717" /LENGTH=125 /DNA_ID=CAMNT_0025033527 /DNA_START=187 /DNA_END=560 /DNA_ORIENTATION=+
MIGLLLLLLLVCASGPGHAARSGAHLQGGEQQQRAGATHLFFGVDYPLKPRNGRQLQSTSLPRLNPREAEPPPPDDFYGLGYQDGGGDEGGLHFYGFAGGDFYGLYGYHFFEVSHKDERKEPPPP